MESRFQGDVMPTKSKSKRSDKSGRRPRRRATRASWRGALQFGLVTFPVEAFNAHETSEDHVAFHQLHRKCHSRVHYQKVCPIHGEIDQEEIVSGYEYSKGRYVEVEPDELDALRTAAERSLTLDAFVAPEDVDVVQFDGRNYFLSPAGDDAREPYTIFLKALQSSGQWGVGQVVWSGREQLAVVRPYEDALHMAMLNYVREIRDPASTVGAPLNLRSSDKKVQLAEQLIEAWTEDSFDLAAYKDTYQAKVREIIDDKVAGKETVAPQAEQEKPEVINLMDALRKSLGQSTRRSGETPHRAGRKTRTTGRGGHTKSARKKSAS